LIVLDQLIEDEFIGLIFLMNGMKLSSYLIDA
jgi:hypothetical protein